MNCCDIPSYLKSLPQTWREELTSVLCEILQTETSVNCSTIKDCETLTSLTELSLNGSALSFTYFDERGSANFRTVDLSSIITPPVDCNFIKSCETLTGVSPLNLSGSILSFAYTDEAGTVNNRQVDLSPIIPAQFTLNTQDSNSIDFSGNGTVGTPLTASLKIETGQPFSITSGGLNLSTQNGLSINSNLLKLGGALTENTTFTNSFKMNWVGPSLHLGPDTTTKASNAQLSIMSRATGDDLLVIGSAQDIYTNYLRIRSNGTMAIGRQRDGLNLGDDLTGGIEVDFNYTGGPYANVMFWERNKPLVISGFGGPNLPNGPNYFRINSVGSTIRSIDKFNQPVGDNGSISQSLRFHVQHGKDDNLNTTESIGAQISSNFSTVSDSQLGRLVNASIESYFVKRNTINLYINSSSIFNDNLGNLEPKSMTSLLIESTLNRQDNLDYQNIVVSNKDIHIRPKFGDAGGYNTIGMHYDPDWDVTAPITGNTEQAIRTERGVINFNNSDNKSYVKFPVHTEATRDTMSSGWGASEKGAQIFVTDGSSPNTMQYWNGTIWVVM